MSLEYILLRRYLIHDFDKVAYLGRGNTLASECIAFLIEWNAVEEGKAKLFYDYFTKNYQGVHQILSYQAVNVAITKKLRARNKDVKAAYDEFVSKYGPLTANDVKGDTWDWINQPWPWEGE
jgi:hypothetical protein